MYNYRNIICIDRNEECYDFAHIDIECSANISLEPNRIGILQESSKFQIIDLLSENNEVIDHNILNFLVHFGSFPIFCGTEVGLLTGKYVFQILYDIVYCPNLIYLSQFSFLLDGPKTKY